MDRVPCWWRRLAAIAARVDKATTMAVFRHCQLGSQTNAARFCKPKHSNADDIDECLKAHEDKLHLQNP